MICSKNVNNDMKIKLIMKHLYQRRANINYYVFITTMTVKITNINKM